MTLRFDNVVNVIDGYPQISAAAAAALRNDAPVNGSQVHLLSA